MVSTRAYYIHDADTGRQKHRVHNIFKNLRGVGNPRTRIDPIQKSTWRGFEQYRANSIFADIIRMRPEWGSGSFDEIERRTMGSMQAPLEWSEVMGDFTPDSIVGLVSPNPSYIKMFEVCSMRLTLERGFKVRYPISILVRRTLVTLPDNKLNDLVLLGDRTALEMRRDLSLADIPDGPHQASDLSVLQSYSGGMPFYQFLATQGSDFIMRLYNPYNLMILTDYKNRLIISYMSVQE